MISSNLKNYTWLYNEFITLCKSQPQIASECSTTQSHVSSILKKYGIKKTMRYPEHLNQEQKSIIYGTLLGDATICIPPKSKNARLQIAHCLKQKELVEFKFKYLKPWVTNDKPTYIKRFTKGTTIEQYIFGTVCNPIFTNIYNKFYTSKRKIITPEILNEVDELALSIWYMDDGSYCKNQSMELATYDFTEQENQIIKIWFQEKWNINVNVRKHHEYFKIYFPMSEREKFLTIVKPYILPSMKYKLSAF